MRNSGNSEKGFSFVFLYLVSCRRTKYFSNNFREFKESNNKHIYILYIYSISDPWRSLEIYISVLVCVGWNVPWNMALIWSFFENCFRIFLTLPSVSPLSAIHCHPLHILPSFLSVFLFVFLVFRYYFLNFMGLFLVLLCH